MYTLPSNMTMRHCLLYILLWITHKAKKQKKNRQICPLLGFCAESQKSTALTPLRKPEVTQKAHPSWTSCMSVTNA